MQWKSLLFFLAAADAALARGHGRPRHNPHKHHVGQVAHLDARDTNIKTLVDVEVVTVYTTVYGKAPAATTSSTTTTAVPLPTETSVVLNNKAVVQENDSSSTSTATEARQSATSTVKPSTAAAVSGSSAWTSVPSTGKYSTARFGKSTNSSGRSGIEYRGNVGSPWGSNIIQVSASEASQYKYVVQFTGSNSEAWTVVFWNKIGPDGKMDGWYGHSALNFTLAAGETRYVAFAENSQGGWGAAAGSELPTDEYGGYSCTWGEFDFGDDDNDGWSGWDVSAIQAQAAGQTVQGMRICADSGDKCSYITTGAEKVVNAYTESKKHIDGIGGSVNSGAVRLKVHVDYSG